MKRVLYNKETRKFDAAPEYMGVVYTCAWNYGDPKSTKSTVIDAEDFSQWLSSQKSKYDYFTIDNKVKGYNKDSLKEQVAKLKESYSKLSKGFRFSAVEEPELTEEILD